MYLKEAYGEGLQFADAGNFDLTRFDNNHSFDVLGKCVIPPPPPLPSHSSSVWRTPTSQGASSSSQQLQPSQEVSSSSSSSSNKKVLAKVRVIRADLNPKGKPYNFIRHNRQSLVVITNEEDANPAFIEAKVKEEMQENIVLVAADGIQIIDQEGTRGIPYFQTNYTLF